MKQKKLIAFDFDGTIADTTALERLAIVRTINLFGNMEINYDNIEDHYGPTEPGIVKSLVRDDKKEEAVEKFFEIYEKTQYETLKACVPGMKELLEDLAKEKDIHVLEVTGRSMRSLEISLAYLGIKDCFEKCYAGSDDGINKNLSLDQACKDYGVNKEDVLYIGDTIADCHTMHDNGYDLISVSYCHDDAYRISLEKLNPNEVVDNTKQLREKLYRLF
jgi:phosphoglycolate phosphatase-like HAD superfamily hydrolase